MSTEPSPHRVRTVEPPTRTRRRRAHRGKERGYVAIVTAIVLPLMLMLAAFAIDTGIYYYRSNQLQRVADAAALAGVTRMPQFPNAQATALDVARRNGIIPGTDQDVVVEPLGDRKIKVTIRDRNISTFFGKLIRDRFDAERKAIAEYSSQIPLGSTLNAIGTGNLAPVSTEGRQNFWLSVSGFCTAKEDGDMVLSRYDGNKRNFRYPVTDQVTEAKKYACPGIAAPADITDPGEPTAGDVIGAKSAVGAWTAGTPPTDGLPELVLNRDFDRTGYNYIVNVPCTSGAQPPCDATDLLPGDLLIQAYDPVFDPGPVSDDPALHKDQRRLFRHPTTRASDDSRLASVHVTTEFRLYGPDTTPLNYEDDVESGWSDATTHIADHALADTTPSDSYGTCHSALGDDPNCATLSDQWTTLIRFPAATRKGRFRVNVRNLYNELVSYGQNSFALRAYFLPSGTNEGPGNPWTPCSSLSTDSLYYQFCPNIAGDTSMAINASATTAGPASFFLAKLTPAAAYRGKKVQVLLWDPGEGGEAVEILGPTKAGDGNSYVSGSFSPVAFTWRLNNPGINSISQSPDDQRTIKNGSAQAEPSYTGCGVGADRATYNWPGDGYQLVSGKFLDISGGPLEHESADATHKCLPFDPSDRGGTVVASTPGSPTPTGRFNGRLVNLEIQIPTNYGLDSGGLEIPLSNDGWWRIRYFPTTTAGVPNTVTDRSTWTVQLIGDPVHLVRG